ncbi:hypothetical protein XAB3213_3720005 [Xanthomonas citri pv. bilvae]|nr:hypothetical protein XAB3213_3720005 [Xanthomonas citri pv. bilvae]
MSKPRRVPAAMKIAILSRNSKLYSTRRLIEAGRKRGHTVRILDPLRCYMRIAADGFSLHYKGKPITGFDAVIPRIGASVTRYGTAVLRQLEFMGTYTPNPSDAILRSRDKLRAHQLLAAQGIDMPVTVFGDNPDDTQDLLSMLGPPPHVVKLNEGAQGAGVILTEKASASRGVVEALRGLYANFIVQEFIGEAEGADLRCFVVGDKVVAAMRRQAPGGRRRFSVQSAPGRHCRRGRGNRTGAGGGGALGTRLGPGSGWGRPDPLKTRPAGAGGQLDPRPGRGGRRVRRGCGRGDCRAPGAVGPRIGRLTVLPKN